MITEVKKISMRDNVKLHCNLIENGSPVWIIVTHGLGEHGGRHSYFYKMFSQYFNICIYDWRGHGKSEGARGTIDQFSDYTEDLHEVLNYLKTEYNLKRYILFGHSGGGLITASYMAKRVQDDLYPEKVFLSAPAVAGAGLAGDLFRVTPLKFNQFLARRKFSFPIGGILDIRKLSHDKRVYENYIKDPDNILKIHTKLLFSILAESREVFSKPLRVKCDLYCAIGSGDVLVNFPACVDYFSKVEKQCKLQVFEGAYHEMHNEVERYRKPYLEFLSESLMSSIYT